MPQFRGSIYRLSTSLRNVGKTSVFLSATVDNLRIVLDQEMRTAVHEADAIEGMSQAPPTPSICLFSTDSFS